MSERFHAGDTVYIKPLGLVGVIDRVLIIQQVGGHMTVVGYEMGSDLSGVACSAEWLELLEGGGNRELAERHEAVGEAAERRPAQ